MAYLDTRDHLAMFATAAPWRGARDDVFERAEWQVIMIAQKEGLASLSEPGWLSRLITTLFGGTVPRPLADPKLEALRRFAVLAWHYSYALPISTLEALRSAGYTESQVELALARISHDRGAAGRRPRG